MKKILIIEDSPYELQLIKNLIDSSMFEISTATHYFEALDLIEINKFDIVVCDHNFPFLKDGKVEALGDQFFLELIHEDFDGIFIHNSSQPCPELYSPKPQKIEFYSFTKNESGLFQLLKKLA